MDGITNQRTAAFSGHGAGRKGRLVQWDDAKGFGWVEANGARIFAHIKEFEKGQPRPVTGDEVTFAIGVDGRGRPRAKSVRLARTTGTTGATGKIGVGAWFSLACLLVLPLFSGVYLPVPQWVVPAVMTTASVVAWHCYRSDKRRAELGQWRIPEAQLHLVELCGGWPGALLAQRRFRHKMWKLGFQFIFIWIVVFHQFVAVEVILGLPLSRWVWREVKEMVNLPSSEPPA
jgi:uncharacterized membrane protein YsdA (DUF1294 family)/cold shock CspA family protein